MNLYSYNNKLFSAFILFILLSSLFTIHPVFSVGSEAVNVTVEDIVVDTINGVGDNFVAGFISAKVNHLSVEECILNANKSALDYLTKKDLVTQKIGLVFGLPIMIH